MRRRLFAARLTLATLFGAGSASADTLALTRLIFLATIAAVLSGCATTRLSNVLQPYVGRDIHELSAHLGNPTGKQETSGDRVYVWSVSSDGVMPKGTDTERSLTVQHECTVEVTVSAENIIRSCEVEGSDAGCAAFRRHLLR
jgi:hypothetical protein